MFLNDHLLTSKLPLHSDVPFLFVIIDIELYNSPLQARLIVFSSRSLIFRPKYNVNAQSVNLFIFLCNCEQ